MTSLRGRLASFAMLARKQAINRTAEAFWIQAPNAYARWERVALLSIPQETPCAFLPILD